MEGCLPQNFNLDEPWQLQLLSLNTILDRFAARASRHEELVIFKADPKPVPPPQKQNKQPILKRKKQYVEIDEDEQNQQEEEEEGKERPVKKAKKSQPAKV